MKFGDKVLAHIRDMTQIRLSRQLYSDQTLRNQAAQTP